MASPGPRPAPPRPVPGPPPGAAGSVQARDLPDYAGRLEEIGALPLEERSAGLAAAGGGGLSWYQAWADNRRTTWPD